MSIGGRPDVRLFLNGDLQFSSIDEYRYHEALVHPAMAGPHRRVLVMGGGDGLALREVLRYPDVEEVTLVELDPAVLRLAREDHRLARLNERSLADPRVEVVEADAFSWVRTAPDPFDVVIADFPDPEDPATAKLYSVEFYGIVSHRVLAPGGRLVVQGGSPYFAADAFWSIDATIREAGLTHPALPRRRPVLRGLGFPAGRPGRRGARPAPPGPAPRAAPLPEPRGPPGGGGVPARPGPEARRPVDPQPPPHPRLRTQGLEGLLGIRSTG